MLRTLAATEVSVPEQTDTDWTEQFPGLARLSAEIRERLVKGSQIVEVPKGTMIFGPGQTPEHLLLLLDGAVRVQQKSDSGREIYLYRVTAGESCVLTTACLLAYEAYAAEGMAETDVRAVAIPRPVFDDLLSRSPEFREFVFAAYARRITDLFMVIDELAFRRVDVRLAARLLALADSSGAVRATHQTLATELGTAREVVSRTLQDFQRRGWIEQARGEIRLLNRDSLTHLARS